MMANTRLTMALLSSVVLAGCTTIPREAGFGDVEKMVAERGVTRVHWNQGTESDEAVALAVRNLLAVELTADQAVQIALLNNRNLQATYEDLSVAQADVVQAGMLSNPVFDVEVRFHEGGEGTGFEGAIVQDFIDLFQIPLRKRVAERQFNAAKLRVAGAVLDLAAQTRAAFYTLQADQQLLEMRRTVMAASEASYEVAGRLRDAGNITELDLAMERTQYEQSKVDLAAAEAAALADRERLSALMGLWGTATNWKIADRLPEVPVDEIALETVENNAIVRSLDLGVYRQQILSTGQQLGVLRPFALFPEAEAGVGAEREAEGGWAVGPVLSGPIPIFDQGQARIASAEAELRRARQLYHALAVEIRSEARAAAIQLRSARDRVQYYRQVILPLRQQVVEQTQLQYNAMQIGPFQLLQAKRDQIETGRQYIDSLREYWIARSSVEQIANGRITRLNINSQSESTGQGAQGQGRNQGGH